MMLSIRFFFAVSFSNIREGRVLSKYPSCVRVEMCIRTPTSALFAAVMMYTSSGGTRLPSDVKP